MNSLKFAFNSIFVFFLDCLTCFQVQFVWYHYFDAHEVFNSIRCYIAAYVWMTGFGKKTEIFATPQKII